MDKAAIKKSKKSKKRSKKSIVRPSFVSVDSQNAALGNLICSHDTEFGVTIGRSEGQFELCSEEFGRFYGDMIHFTINGCSGRAYVDQYLVNLILNDLGLQIPFYDMPVTMQRAVLNAAISRILKSMSSLFPTAQVEVSGYTLNLGRKSSSYEEDAESSDALRCSGRLSCMNQSVYFGLEFDAGAFFKLNQFLKQCSRPDITSSHFIDVPIIGKVIMGWQSMSIAELAQLRQNDVVILEGAEPGKAYLSFLNMANFELEQVASNPNDNEANLSVTYRIISQTKGKTMDDYPENGSLNELDGEAGDQYDFTNAPVEQSSDSGVSQQNIPVNMVFEMGRTQLSFEDVQYLEVGYTFDLGVDPNNAVAIMANGVKVGDAEIVEIGGRLGARIVNLRK